MKLIINEMELDVEILLTEGGINPTLNIIRNSDEMRMDFKCNKYDTISITKFLGAYKLFENFEFPENLEEDTAIAIIRSALERIR